MRFCALATDYDGTIARHGTVDDETLAALQRYKEHGGQLIMVTGRELPDLFKVFPHSKMFDRIVAENGALLYTPDVGTEKMLAEPPPAAFAEWLRNHGVSSLSVGRVIVATWEPHESLVLKAIGELGLELQVIFNKGAVMVLPSGVNKATGLASALKELNLASSKVAGVGDAENDHSFLSKCGVSCAVSNALDSLKAEVDFLPAGSHGQGVAELIDHLIRDDLDPRPKATLPHVVSRKETTM